MKEHLINLIYLQFQQEQQLAKIYKEEDGNTDILAVVLDILVILKRMNMKSLVEIGSIKN